MRQRIHTGGGGDGGRQPKRQFRIEDRITRDELQIHNRIFVMCIRIDDHGCNRRLRPRACRCRDGEKRIDRMPYLQQTAERRHAFPGICCARGSRFCCVHRRAAADGDKTVAYFG